MDSFSLKNQKFVVVGGSGLLGRSVISSIYQAGGEVLNADLLKSDPASLANYLEFDAVSENSVANLFREIHGLGGVNGMVNCSYPRGSGYGTGPEELSFEQFCSTVNVHLGSYFLITREFAKYFAKAGGGSIVNLSSIYGIKAPRFDLYEGLEFSVPAEYVASKAGINQLTRYFAALYIKAGVRCNVGAPGGVVDNQPEVFLERYREYAGTKGMLDPGDIAGSVVFFLSGASQYITGQVLTIDEGWSL